MRRFLGIMIAAVIVMSGGATAATAFTETSRVQGDGYAGIYWNINEFASCDTAADTFTFLGQAWNRGGRKFTARDTTSSAGCTYRDMSSTLTKMRGCSDRVFDICGPMRYR